MTEKVVDVPTSVGLGEAVNETIVANGLSARDGAVASDPVSLERLVGIDHRPMPLTTIARTTTRTMRFRRRPRLPKSGTHLMPDSMREPNGVRC